MFLLDESSSINQTNWQHILSFVSKVSEEFSIGKDLVCGSVANSACAHIGTLRTQVAVGTFSSPILRPDGSIRSSYLHIPFDSSRQLHHLQAAISTIPHGGGATYTREGLQLVHDVLNGSVTTSLPRPIDEGIARVLILVTDGNFTAGHDPTEVAASIRNMHRAAIFSVNIIDGDFTVDSSELAISAALRISPGAKDFVDRTYVTSSFEELDRDRDSCSLVDGGICGLGQAICTLSGCGQDRIAQCPEYIQMLSTNGSLSGCSSTIGGVLLANACPSSCCEWTDSRPRVDQCENDRAVDCDADFCCSGTSNSTARLAHAAFCTSTCCNRICTTIPTQTTQVTASSASSEQVPTTTSTTEVQCEPDTVSFCDLLLCCADDLFVRQLHSINCRSTCCGVPCADDLPSISQTSSHEATETATTTTTSTDDLLCVPDVVEFCDEANCCSLNEEVRNLTMLNCGTTCCFVRCQDNLIHPSQLTTSSVATSLTTSWSDEYYCHSIECGMDCKGVCGWSSSRNMCIAGGKTRPSEEHHGRCTFTTQAHNTALQTYQWNTGTSMPLDLAEVSSIIVGSVLLVFGEGSRKTLQYDISKKTWTIKSKRLYSGGNMGIATISALTSGGTDIYLIGGFGKASKKTQIYSVELDSWREGPKSPSNADGSLAVVAIQGRIYACGGIRLSKNKAIKRCYSFDPVSESWNQISSMLVAVHHSAVGTDGHFMYVFGGFSGEISRSEGLNVVQIYDPIRDAWQFGSPLPSNRGGMGSAAFLDGMFFLVGGKGSLEAYTDTFVYNDDNWYRGPNLPSARHGIYPVIQREQRSLLVAGGGSNTDASSTTLQVLQIPVQMNQFQSVYLGNCSSLSNVEFGREDVIIVPAFPVASAIACAAYCYLHKECAVYTMMDNYCYLRNQSTSLQSNPSANSGYCNNETFIETQEPSTSTHTVVGCGHILCGADCSGPCGWSSRDNTCRYGARTTEKEKKKGDCSHTNTTLTTSPPVSMEEDHCSNIQCGADCINECGWSTKNNICKTGARTSIKERLSGQCHEDSTIADTSTATIAVSPSSPQQFLCSQILCGAQCTGSCGWSSKYDVCKEGARTSAEELSSGTCPDSCAAYLCGANCTGKCGWSRKYNICLEGAFTNAEEINLGQCN